MFGAPRWAEPVYVLPQNCAECAVIDGLCIRHRDIPLAVSATGHGPRATGYGAHCGPLSCARDGLRVTSAPVLIFLCARRHRTQAQEGVLSDLLKRAGRRSRQKDESLVAGFAKPSASRT